MKIFLIGMPGSGKTTLGKQLAFALSLPFIDLDHEIEKEEGTTIKDIFSNKGEAYFRQVESNMLKTWATSSDDFVLATGGGAPCFHGGIDIINESGISIFLDVPVRELVNRVEQNTDRPLLSVNEDAAEKRTALAEKLTAIRSNRIGIYRQASVIIDDPAIQLNDVLKIFRT